jgi:hypothetical protein
MHCMLAIVIHGAVVADLLGVLERALVVLHPALCGRTIRVQNMVGPVNGDTVRVELDRSGVVFGCEGLVGLGFEGCGLERMSRRRGRK